MADKAVEKKEEVKAPEAEITETDLLKAATDLEAAATGEKPVEEPAADPKVALVAAPELAKTIEDKGSEPMAKSLEISSTLKEIVDLLGEHVDGLSKSFAGTLDNQNAAILSICGALEGMQKSLGELKETVEKYGEKPAAPASAKEPTAKGDEVLSKGAGAGSGDEEQSPDVTKDQVSDALLRLTKSAKKDSDEDMENHWCDAAVKFSATGQISDRDLSAALTENKRING